MVGYVIVPGIGGSDEAHWQTRWEQQWGAEAVRIEPRSWSHPDLPDWVEAIERAVKTAESRNDELALVAHSLGCWAASTWLQQAEGRRLRGALLVAPPDPTSDAFPAAAASTFVSAVARPLPCRSVVVVSTNDPYCDVRTARDFASIWGSDVEVVGELGHINSASALDAWGQGRELLERALSR
jgi:predicted alpha/beta hydrolase family esterase